MTTFDPRRLVTASQQSAAAPPAQANPLLDTTAGPAGTSSSSSSSSGSGPGLGGIAPYMTPQQAMEFQSRFNPSDLVYSLPAGGYITQKDTDANSYYMKFGGSNPLANQRAREMYDYLGGLPTTHVGGSQALALLQGNKEPEFGPSINEQIGSPWQGPWQIQPSKFSSTPLSGGGIAW
jgi:hypothetical protein